MFPHLCSQPALASSAAAAAAPVTLDLEMVAQEEYSLRTVRTVFSEKEINKEERKKEERKQGTKKEKINHLSLKCNFSRRGTNLTSNGALFAADFPREWIRS